jgi:hypothetical protein
MVKHLKKHTALFSPEGKASYGTTLVHVLEQIYLMGSFNRTIWMMKFPRIQNRVYGTHQDGKQECRGPQESASKDGASFSFSPGWFFYLWPHKKEGSK